MPEIPRQWDADEQDQMFQKQHYVRIINKKKVAYDLKEIYNWGISNKVCNYELYVWFSTSHKLLLGQLNLLEENKFMLILLGQLSKYSCKLLDVVW